MMDKKQIIQLLSTSSSGNPYTVRFYLEENEISSFCSCPAGKNRMLCKHIMKMINGDESILYDSSQKKLLEEICSYMKNTPIPLLLSELDNSEKLLSEARQNVKKAKKNLEKVILEK